MRLEPKSAAAICAAAFALLLIFGAVWPGPGLWLLAAALGCTAAAAAAWWIDPAPRQGRPAAYRTARTPFAAPYRHAGGGAALGVAGAIGARGGWTAPERVHLAFVAGASGLLAFMLFVGGALGGGDADAPAAVALDANPEVIDRSRDGDPIALPAVPPPAAATPVNPAVSPAEAEPSNAARPIVVAAPKPATPVEPQEPEPPAAPPARTVQHTVAAGDTLYEIALTYESTVDAIVTLNGLSAAAIIHPGDILLIPQPDE